MTGARRWGRSRAARLAGSGVLVLGCAAIAAALGLAIAALVTGELPGDPTWPAAPVAVTSVAVAGVAWWLRPVAARTWRAGGRRVAAPEEVLRDLGRRAAGDSDEDGLVVVADAILRAYGAAAVEVWRCAPDGTCHLAAAVPYAERADVTLDADAVAALGSGARAAVVGASWLDLWMPALRAGRPDAEMRCIAAAHGGRLLGLVLLVRRVGAERFTPVDDVQLAELGGRLGLVLHNQDLDVALRSTLHDLRRANAELRASQVRIVTAADAERRRIERNLHDGAQQHLVALAVQLQLAADEVAADPAASTAVFAALRDDLREAIDELRSLAHGIYPPLLRDAGLAQALRAAARRSSAPVTVQVGGIGRYAPEVEAAVYFCCVEALQNAAKHAPGAPVRLAVTVEGEQLRFEVEDEGPGIADGSIRHGHGLANMADRVAALDGTLDVRGRDGGGTVVVGTLPALPGDGGV